MPPNRAGFRLALRLAGMTVSVPQNEICVIPSKERHPADTKPGRGPRVSVGTTRFFLEMTDPAARLCRAAQSLARSWPYFDAPLPAASERIF